MEEEWKIASGRKECARCGRKFEEGETLFSALYEEGYEFKRLDYCRACWGGSGEGTFSFWRTQVPPNDEPNPLPPNEALLEMFRKLREGSNARREQFRYVLALLLRRKKVLKLLRRDRRAGGEEVLVLEERGSGENSSVTVPRLSEAEAKGLSDELSGLLNARVEASEGSRSEDDEDRGAGVPGGG